MLQGGTLHELHDQKGAALLLLNIVNGADIRMIERRCGASFALEAFQSLRIVGNLVWKKLESDEATELEVFRFKYHTHATAANVADYAVMGNRLPNGLEGRAHCPKW